MAHQGTAHRQTLTALITGASSGLGAEYARQLTARGDSVVLVARDRQALDTLAAELRARGAAGVPATGRVEVLSVDLLDDNQLAQVIERLRDDNAPIGMLINNAGFGLPLSFESNEIEAETQHLRLHNEVPMRLTHAALQVMLARGHGRIVNMASVAAFIPRSTYAAAKQWLVGFSRWANARYRKRGVTVTAVCPGFTHTNFHERLGLPPGQEGVPSWMWLDAKKVVSASLRDIERGKSLSIPSLKYKVLAGVARVVPAGLAANVGKRGRL
ncbi:MAG: SDR family NAD(P)-dependent oxidoreductase [Leucobacter sp.]|jgi:short-subunit dehydrogenase|nr:SDR family NAD(P)-dependent oxidoreductase [Leucobacter sp.]